MPISECEFRQLWREYGARVRAVIAGNRLLDPATTPEDIEQEVMLRLWQVLSGETQIEHSASYIRRVTHSALIDAVRRAQVRETSRRNSNVDVEAVAQNNASPNDGERAVYRQELQDVIDVAMGRLKENRRRAVALRLNGLTAVEIARLCGWPKAKTRNLIYRGLAQVREHLTEQGITLESESREA